MMSAKHNVKQYIVTSLDLHAVHTFAYSMHVSQQGDEVMKPGCKKKTQTLADV